FDDDPFLIFQVRGRTREQIVGALRDLRAAEADAPAAAPASIERAPALSDLLDTFYQAGAELDAIAPRIAAPEVPAALLKRLGPAPEATDDDLRALYQAMSARALERVYEQE